MPNTLVPPLKSYSPTFSHFCLKSPSLHPPRVKHAIRLFSIYVKEFSRFGWLSKPHPSPWTISSYSPLHHPSHPSPLSTLIFLFPPNFAPWSRKCILIKLLRKKVHSLWWWLSVQLPTFQKFSHCVTGQGYTHNLKAPLTTQKSFCLKTTHDPISGRYNEGQGHQNISSHNLKKTKTYLNTYFALFNEI